MRKLGACLFIWSVLSASCCLLAEDTGKPEKKVKATVIGVVDVSSVFMNYQKVTDVNSQIEKDFEPRRTALHQERVDIKKLGEKLQELKRKRSKQSEFLFDQEQYFEKQLFLHAKKTRNMELDMAMALRKNMREVLNEIRAGIHKVAQQKGIQLVMRSADTSKMNALGAEKDAPTKHSKDKKKSVQEQVNKLLEPRTMVDIIGRFKRNPVLFGAESCDITADVLKHLNDQYKKKASR